jgi:hypothetical protein
MKITKVLEARIDINDINHIFSANYNETVLKMLKEKFKGRCFKSVYILDILRIIRRSDFNCKNKTLDGNMYVDVQFEVEGLVYEQNEILHNCKIVHINNNGTIHAKSEHASILIKNVGIMIFKEGSFIPVIVNTVRYPVYDNEISISGFLFIHMPIKHTVFKISQVTDELYMLAYPDLTNELNNMNIKDIVNIKEIKALEDKLNKANKDSKTAYTFFRELLYPKKHNMEVVQGTTKNITLENLENLKESEYVYIPEYQLDSFIILRKLGVGKTMVPSGQGSMLEITKKDFTAYCMNDYKKKLQQLIDFIETYNSKEKITANSAVWKLYMETRKSLNESKDPNKVNNLL